MKVSEAIKQADDLRMNTISDEQKYEWLFKLDGSLAEFFSKPIPINTFPDDATLMVEAPYDSIYPLYLVAQIDYYNEESALYSNDMQLYNAALMEALACNRRKNNPSKDQGWKI